MKSIFKKVVIFLVIYFLYSLPAILFRTDKDFYYSINKPSYAPKPVVFSVVWPILYFIFAAFLTYKITSKTLSKETKLAFIMNYIVSFPFNYVFFNMQNLFLSFSLTFLSFSTGIAIFFTLIKENRYNASIITPYLLWTLFASILNAHIYFIN